MLVLWLLASLVATTLAQSASPTPAPYTSVNALYPANEFTLDVTQPVRCSPMNITFDPRRGTPPFTLMVAIEDWYPLVVELPASYDDPNKALWLYQYPVPIFDGRTTNPNLIVSVVDSTGFMSNSSVIVQVQNNTDGSTCPIYADTGDFIFYTEKAASQCELYDIVWRGNYTAPLEMVFLPEAAPPIYVPVDDAAAGNMSWTVAMRGGTRFLMTMGDAGAKTGGVSKINIVALNEYYSDDCILPNTYSHNVLQAQTMAPPASIFPDATSTLASLSTSNGIVATVTTIETIRSGRQVEQSRGKLTGKALVAVAVVVSFGFGIAGVVIGWCCFRRRQKRKTNIKSWDLPNSDPSTPFNADPNMPITKGFLGRRLGRMDSATASDRDLSRRPSFTPSDSYQDATPLRHAPLHLTSLRSWNSGGEAWNNTSHADEYPLVRTNSNPFGNQHAASTQSDTYGSQHYSRGSRVSDGAPSSVDALSPTDSLPRPFDTPDGSLHRTHSAAYRSASSPSRSHRQLYSESAGKSNRVGAGATYRPDAASQAAYQDLLSNTTSPSGTLATYTHSSRPSASSQGSRPGRNAPSTQPSSRVIRHSDAGLLLDDTVDGDELVDVELPPMYDTIHPAQQDNLLREYRQQQRGRQEAVASSTGDISDQRTVTSPVVDSNHSVFNDEDEAEFWNDVGSAR